MHDSPALLSALLHLKSFLVHMPIHDALNMRAHG